MPHLEEASRLFKLVTPPSPGHERKVACFAPNCALTVVLKASTVPAGGSGSAARVWEKEGKAAGRSHARYVTTFVVSPCAQRQREQAKAALIEGSEDSASICRHDKVVLRGTRLGAQGRWRCPALVERRHCCLVILHERTPVDAAAVAETNS